MEVGNDKEAYADGDYAEKANFIVARDAVGDVF